MIPCIFCFLIDYEFRGIFVRFLATFVEIRPQTGQKSDGCLERLTLEFKRRPWIYTFGNRNYDLFKDICEMPDGSQS